MIIHKEVIHHIKVLKYISKHNVRRVNQMLMSKRMFDQLPIIEIKSNELIKFKI